MHTVKARKVSNARVAEGGRIVIPVDLRKKLGMEIGEIVYIELAEDDSLRVSTRKRSLRRAQELFRKHVPSGISLVDEFIAERRKEAADE